MSGWFEAQIKDQAGLFPMDVSFGMNREIGVLFGPSGSGKSMTLRCLAGLRKVRQGRIRLGQKVLLDTNAGIFKLPQERRVGLLFQDLALFPHMTVLENVAFACNCPQSARANTRAQAWLERVRLESYGNRYPSQLSGGQRQRVALARALAAEPEMLMLDEPFNALDGPLRRNLRRELRKLQAETGIPLLYVTHQVEDLCALGDRVFFMEKGKMTGSAFVKDLLSGRDRRYFWQMMGWGNVLEGVVATQPGGHPVFRWPGGCLSLKGTETMGSATAFVRPDKVRFLDPCFPADEEIAPNILSGKVEEVFLEGGVIRMHVRTPGGDWQVEQGGPGAPVLAPRPGEEVIFAVPPVAIELIYHTDVKEGDPCEPIAIGTHPQGN